MSGELTFTEISVMLMLGAIVSSSMQIPERGIMEGCLVLVLVLLLQRFVTLWMFKSSKAEDMILSKMYLLIKDGVLQVNDLRKEYITRTTLFTKVSCLIWINRYAMSVVLYTRHYICLLPVTTVVAMNLNLQLKVISVTGVNTGK